MTSRSDRIPRRAAAALAAVTVAALLSNGDVSADEADVIEAEIRATGETFTISATIAHPDTGWEHYADAFEVRTSDGTTLGVRELAHPHVNEQPFTRSLSGVEIPDDISEVVIRARDSVHGFGGAAITLDVPR